MAKKTTSKTETEQVPTPVTQDTSSSSVVKNVKKTKSVKSDVVTPVEVVTTTPVVSSSVVSSSVVENVVSTEAVDNEPPIAEQSIEFLAKLQQLSIQISALKAEYRVLEKKWTRDIKAAQKLSTKRKRKAGNRAPSGFVKPTKISDELASFLGKEKGTEMARTDVTREINTYIRAHKLQDKDNGRKINPDTKLAALLKLKKNDELTYFNLQKYMSPHFAKAVKVDTVTVTVTA